MPFDLSVPLCDESSACNVSGISARVMSQVSGSALIDILAM